MGSSNGGGGGSTQHTTQTIQNADPWAGQQPYLRDVFQQAQQLYYGTPPSYYPGTTVAPFTGAERQAQQWALDYARNGLPAAINEAMAANSLLMDPMLIDIANNPYVQAMNEASVQDYIQAAQQSLGDISAEFMRKWLPALDSGAVASGQYGGSRQGVAQGLAVGDAARYYRDWTESGLADLGNLLATTNLGAYGQGLEAMGRATMTAPSLIQSSLLPMQVVSSVGAQRRDMNQALIDDAIARWNYTQGLPTQRLADYASLIAGQYGGQSSSTTTGTVPGQSSQASTGGQLAGAALTGLSTYGFMSGTGGAALMGSAAAATAAAPWAAGLMAMLSFL